MSGYKIMEYQSSYEKSWIRCRILSFLDSAYYDDVYTEKEKYNNPSIGLIAVYQNEVIGFLDLEYELEANAVCSKNEKLEPHLAGMIWHLGTHPDFRKQGIARNLLEKAVQLARKKNLKRLEAWTRDDKFVNDWYTKNGFSLIQEYIHWYYNAQYDEQSLLKNILQIDGNISQVVRTFGHSNTMTTEISKLRRKYFCKRFDKLI